MSYRCAVLGVPGYGPEWRKPRVICDGCSVEIPVYKKHINMPKKWFMDGKRAPGWSGGRKPDYTREDYCPACTLKRLEKK